jgi:TrmH family RNA methyltransferase
MGAVFRKDVVQVSWSDAREALDAAEIPVAVTALSPRAEDIRKADVRAMAVVIGSEGQGVRQQTLEHADHELIIPMNEKCESLNAAVASAIVCWQMQQV